MTQEERAIGSPGIKTALVCIVEGAETEEGELGPGTVSLKEEGGSLYS